MGTLALASCIDQETRVRSLCPSYTNVSDQPKTLSPRANPGSTYFRASVSTRPSSASVGEMPSTRARVGAMSTTRVIPS